jgi:hypothetical protein
VESVVKLKKEKSVQSKGRPGSMEGWKDPGQTDSTRV